MINANIVIIDSGLDIIYHDDEVVMGGITLERNAKAEVVVSSDYIDVLGHGTAIYNMIKNTCSNSTTFFIIRIFNDVFECEQELLLYALEYVHDFINCDFIHVSSGAIAFNSLKQLDNITRKLYCEKKCIIVSAFSNERAISYPAACDYVIGVDTSPDVVDYLIVNGSPINILASKKSQRLVWLGGKRIINNGCSFTAAEFTAKLFNAYSNFGIKNIHSLLEQIKDGVQEVYHEKIDLTSLLNPSYIKKNKKLRAIAFPFSKEIQVLAANEDMLTVEIINYYDVRESGRVGLAVNDILKYCNNTKRINNIYEIETIDDYDLIICGHMGQLNKISKVNWTEFIDKIVENKSKYLYSFDPNPVSHNRRNEIFSPPIITGYNGYTFGKLWRINSPVLGVFGTSSVQGKFSLQIKLRKALINNGYNIKQLSTEPTGALLGMDYICPIGYNSSILLKAPDSVKFYNELMHLCDIEDPDIIVVGCQSATMLLTSFHEQYFAFTQYEYLVGTSPDAIILMVNEFDNIDYIKRCIAFIESTGTSTVIACVISPVNNSREIINKDSLSLFNEQICYINKPYFKYEQFDELYSLLINFFSG